ncbi:MAG TPA: hypothetical protein PLG17_04985 [Thermodesulfobacteriota bacterium]|nr:hypothetical protein [Deltaproteobacteria bacterium]HNR14203.1 hypothetical protein [Thermodesulfobacteriota bacterium]HNU72587.1 hypothetical protein [Thermodesulfobacteriota bacterium]HOC38751.1 hypothetical protein [Thermodesulfobacteriota bacterium]HQO77850.1 hypothetical protein [Thermodesulfobacteriota bacterium]
MGRERATKRKRFYLCLASLILALSCACTAERTCAPENPAQEHLVCGKELLSRKDFEPALTEFQLALSLAGPLPPGDEALYGIGLVYAHEDNPAKDLAASQQQFAHLVSEYPASPFAPEAEIWILMLKELQILKTREKKLTAPQPETRPEIASAEKYLLSGRKLVEQGKFAEGLSYYDRALALAPCESPGDHALMDMALVFVHHNNPGRDYNKSLVLFRKLIHDFPSSSLVPQAAMWIDVLQTLEKTKQVDIEIEEKQKQLIQ